MKEYLPKYKSKSEGGYVEIHPDSFVMLYRERYSTNAIGLAVYDKVEIDHKLMRVTVLNKDKITFRAEHAKRILDMRDDINDN